MFCEGLKLRVTGDNNKRTQHKHIIKVDILSESLEERLKYAQFNQTDYQVLGKLVQRAIDRGVDIQNEQKILGGITKRAYEILSRGSFLKTFPQAKVDLGEFRSRCTIGVDGSFYPAGGTAGLWYAPISAVRVMLRKGIDSLDSFNIDSDLEAFGDIILIDEAKLQKEHYTENVNGEIIKRMMELETKAIMLTATRNKGSILMMDGPVVDPPTFSGKDYLKYRCDAFKNCIANDVLAIGCVKRIKDNFTKGYVKENFVKTPDETAVFEKFPTDMHLMAYVFTYMRTQLGITDVIYTNPIETSDRGGQVYKKYKEQGLRLACMFIQKDLRSSILRLDIPLVSEETELTVDAEPLVRLVAGWTYPDLGTPMPVYLAHEKCQIRQGCADVLYDEILTRMRTTDPFNQIASMNLR